MAVKPTSCGDYREVIYSEARWTQLKTLRVKAATIMTALELSHMHAIVHGSTARGDVKKDSDIDIFITEIPNSFLVETALEKANLPISNRRIVQATPNNAMKAHIELDEQTTVSFPLMEMRLVQREFYRFGGQANLAELKANLRISGIDKRLMLIEPTKTGHIESNIINKEETTANLLGISTQTILNRVHTLLRRDTVGRTGIYIKKELTSQETFEQALKKLAETNPAVRRRLKG
ncbi:nucleotidyltransferase domain-containing protein [Candidatus Bathycorpusculum sp.]|uniref:nucleotidyltransferase domain-containing protein n=1 Tax=Candidatus Bathycorpusculum sp. TaxID=2994959 RepID=UPI00282996F4|nr:nucleotidyltransferase domain-containing protein [Candidatus Termitimicrobium sp.]